MPPEILLLPPPSAPIRLTTLPGKLHELQIAAAIAVAKLNAALAATSPSVRRAANQPERWLFIAPESADPFGTRHQAPASRPSGNSFGPARANGFQPTAPRPAGIPSTSRPPTAAKPPPSIDDLLANL